MSLFRNKELKQQFITETVFALLASLIGLSLGISTSFSIFLSSFLLEGIHLYFTNKRYQNIANLTYQMDTILHENTTANLITNKEGELSILSNEIYKMTIKLREQRDALKKEKQYLKNYMEDISHQIRTPLTSIKLLMFELSKEKISPEKQRKIIQEMKKMLSRMEWLITTLLQTAQLESETVVWKKERLNIKELMEKSLEPLQILAELKSITIEMDIKSNLYYEIDSYWTTEAMTNIIKNCIEHSSEGKKITISARENPIYMEIQIQDNGTGIKKEDLPHIFERFYKGENPNKQSIGIGLFLSKMIIAKQNGTIRAKNKEVGTEFQIQFYKNPI